MFPTLDDAFDPDLPDALRPPSCAGVWTRAREDYQAGESASAVCERYGLTRSVFFKRAKEEGWRKSDSPAAEPDTYVDEMEAALVDDMLLRPATPAYALARRAWALAEVSLMRRRRLEAMSWVRVAKELRKLAMEEAGGHTWRRTAQLCEEAAVKEREAAFEKPEPDGSSPPLRSGGGGGEADGGGDANERSLSSPPPPPSGVPLPRCAGEEKAPDHGLLPLSILSSRTKLNAFLEAEFGPADSADRSARTADSDLSARFHPPHLDGEVAAQQTEGPRDSAETAAATLPLGAGPSGPLPAFGRTPHLRWGRGTAGPLSSFSAAPARVRR